MKIYKIDASSLFLQEGNPNITNGVIYTSTKKTALKTARSIFREAKQFSKSLKKSEEASLNSTETGSLSTFAHEWASGSPGSINVYTVRSKAMPARTLAEVMLNNGDWIESEELVFTKSF